MNGDVQDLEETASVGRGSPVQQELEDSETEASTYIVSFENLIFHIKFINTGWFFIWLPPKKCPITGWHSEGGGSVFIGKESLQFLTGWNVGAYSSFQFHFGLPSTQVLTE